MKYPATLIGAFLCSTVAAAPEQVTVIRRVIAMILTAKAGGQSKPMPRFRRQTRAQFKPWPYERYASPRLNEW